MSWDLLLMVFLHVNYLCLMMRKNQINLSALNTADMLKYIKVIFQGPVVFLSRGRGGGWRSEDFGYVAITCCNILVPLPPLFPVNWQSFFYHPSFYFVGSEIFPLHSLRKPCDPQNPPSPPPPPPPLRREIMTVLLVI